MKTNFAAFVLFLTLAFSGQVFAQFPNFPAADLVLGAADFVTAGSLANTPSGMATPTGLAIDPTTGKIFVSATSQFRILRFASASALTNGVNAEAVLGQVNFSGTSLAVTQSKFDTPRGLFVDSKGRLWMADASAHRVLMFEGAATLSNGAPADLVLGQPDFTTPSSGTSAIKMFAPTSVFVDDDDNLWVVEQGNDRVIKFPMVSTLGNGAPATVALGQPNLVTGSSGTSATKMTVPGAIVVDGAGRLWVADTNNNRILRFDNAASLATGAAASGVLGQTDFVTGTFGTTAEKIKDPVGLAVDSNGTLYVLELSNHRVLLFHNAAAKADGAAADMVIGQPDFVSGGPGLSARQFNFPNIGITLDTTGRLLVADSGNHRVLRFSPDRTKPSLTITSRIPRTTTKGRLTVSGSATDASGIASVRFRSGRGAFKTVAGTTRWRTKVSLKPGKNSLEFLATDVVGNLSASRRAKVTRN
jgi:sugar lactone lactonase YvrE